MADTHIHTMTIKTDDGHMYDVASNAKANTGVVLGSIGTGLGILGSHIGGIFGGNLGRTGADGSQYVTKDELNYVQTIAAKDSEIALLKSEQNTEIKIADVYERLITRINADKNEQTAINAQQMVYNATANSSIAVLQSQVAALQCLTKVIVPAESVCPQPMPKYNSWTAPTA